MEPHIKLTKGGDFYAPVRPTYMIVLSGNSCNRNIGGWGLALFVLSRWPYLHLSWAHNVSGNTETGYH